MSFNINYFSQMSYGGAGANSIWHYFDYAADNVASLATGAVNTGFFSIAYSTYGIAAKAGDMIFVASRSSSTTSTQTASPCIFMVPNNWDANGASVAGYLYYRPQTH